MYANKTTRLAVIIVSYNTCALLRDCLHSLLDSLTLERAWLESSVVVVDNGSSDGSAAMVACEFPQVTLRALEANLGFTGGNNLALAMLGLLDRGDVPASLPMADFVLLLNPDTRVVGNAPAELVRFLQSTPDAGVCGAGLHYGDGRFQHAAFAFPRFAQVALDLVPLHRLPLGARLYDSALNGRYPAALWQSGRPFAVDFVLGAALMIRGAVVREIGALDDAYFMYCEEMDWCLRAAQKGWRVYAVPSAQVVHYEAQSSRSVRWPAYARLWRSRLLFYSLHGSHFAPGTLLGVRLLATISMSIGARLAMRRFARGQSSGVAAGNEIAARHVIVRVATRRMQGQPDGMTTFSQP